MSTEKRKNLLLFAAVTLLAILLFAACGSKAATAADKIELGQKYLIELELHGSDSLFYRGNQA